MAFDYKLDWNAESVIRAIEGAVEVASKKGAEMVAADARRLCPVKSGALKESIKVSKSKYADGGHIVSVGGDQQYYASFVELGRAGVLAKPFMRPALARNKPKIRKMFRDALK